MLASSQAVAQQVYKGAIGAGQADTRGGVVARGGQVLAIAAVGAVGRTGHASLGSRADALECACIHNSWQAACMLAWKAGLTDHTLCTLAWQQTAAASLHRAWVARFTTLRAVELKPSPILELKALISERQLLPI